MPPNWSGIGISRPATARQSRISPVRGIVNVRYEPYVELMKEINREVYPLTEYFDRQK